MKAAVAPFRGFGRDGDGGSGSVEPGALGSWAGTVPVRPGSERLRRLEGGKGRGGGGQVRRRARQPPFLSSGYTHACFLKYLTSTCNERLLTEAWPVYAPIHWALPPTALDLLMGPDVGLPFCRSTGSWAPSPGRALSHAHPACLAGGNGGPRRTRGSVQVGVALKAPHVTSLVWEVEEGGP